MTATKQPAVSLKTMLLILILMLTLLLTGCQGGASTTAQAYPCQVVFEETEGILCEEPVTTADEAGDAAFHLTLTTGDTLGDISWPDYTLVRDSDGAGLILTLHNLRYSTVVSAVPKSNALTLLYHANGGQRADGGDANLPVRISVSPSHLRLNTENGTGLFTREGYTLTGWNTRPDGSGTAAGLGSRVDFSPGLTLYACWQPWTKESLFEWTTAGDSVTITGTSCRDEVLTLPAQIEGKPVRTIARGALEGCPAATVILPPGLMTVEPEAFKDARLRELYLFDDLVSITDYAFTGCDQLTTLHINAATDPVYSGTYFDTFSDKYDRLLSLKGQPKLVLFSGSSARFGYDSALIDEAFSGYQVVNMGVFAYTNALPQLLLILEQLTAGDVLLHSPEFDAAKRQFCTTTALDAPFYSMMESDYGNVARLDLKEFTDVFTAFNAYLAARRQLPGKSYDLSPADYDEDGNPVSTPSYNIYGDYILYRPNPEDEQPVYGLPVDYTVKAFPKEDYIKPLNRVLTRFVDRGVSCFITYAPRNMYALSEQSTREERDRLEAYFNKELVVPVISSLESSLYPGTLLYGTDNHLSTEGARLRTREIIDELNTALAGMGGGQ